uniref:Ovule protein n=1 Tax=Heterorhabditis bacteriophora TaxID=37862 RepID=A0A1I7W775_HETBA
MNKRGTKSETAAVNVHNLKLSHTALPPYQEQSGTRGWSRDDAYRFGRHGIPYENISFSKFPSRTERLPGCECHCHLKTLVTVSPRSAHFTPKGGLSIHNLMNMSKSLWWIGLHLYNIVLSKVGKLQVYHI